MIGMYIMDKIGLGMMEYGGNISTHGIGYGPSIKMEIGETFIGMIGAVNGSMEMNIGPIIMDMNTMQAIIGIVMLTIGLNIITKMLPGKHNNGCSGIIQLKLIIFGILVHMNHFIGMMNRELGLIAILFIMIIIMNKHKILRIYIAHMSGTLM